MAKVPWKANAAPKEGLQQNRQTRRRAEAEAQEQNPKEEMSMWAELAISQEELGLLQRGSDLQAALPARFPFP
jgi:hypothetical protein